MKSKIKHMAIISTRPRPLGNFYKAVFGMTGDYPSTGRSAVVSDGYVGLNINALTNGRKAGLNHWGFEVDDVPELEARLRERYPQVQLLSRPSNRPFAGISTHDPEGNIFDISQGNMANRRGVYVAEEEQRPRHISHFMVPAMDAPAPATFYRDIYDLKELPRAADDPNHYLSDGVVTLIVHQWRLEEFGMGGLDGKPSIDHIGFRVESLERFLEDVDRLAETEPTLAPAPFQGESAHRREVFATAAIGQYQLADPDSVLLDVTDR